MIRKKISFVILTWKRSKMLKICLEELINSIHDKSNSEIIIFDNASNDDTESVILEFIEKYKNIIDIQFHISKENLRLKAYKQLFKMATGDIVVEVDDDVLAYPSHIDEIFIKYFNTFKKFGFLALDVIQNEHTNGAKPDLSYYNEVAIDNLIVQKGPTGGWCAGFRARDFRKISWIFNLLPLSMKLGEDGALQNLFRLIGKKSGIIKDQKCFHAAGPFYSKQFKQLERDIEKYKVSGLTQFVDEYGKVKNEN
ncbi:glycosyltransferase family 2 protein [Acinetobacter johnsonii]|uniref:glycosyltransferase family A protein n=1 Tax=Acinetobacter johnsonii TaxID=40214 RepID=UPI00244728E2|nr:glycosyltransferase family A protein [Acinetobacter johnsonii]MDH1240705.1 glycosyltransferase family 2 protein [Acinetobacter johnsonii]